MLIIFVTVPAPATTCVVASDKDSYVTLGAGNNCQGFQFNSLA